MSRATALAARVSTTLSRLGGFDRILYKRVITKTGTSKAQLVGRATNNTVDTLLSPQPIVYRLGRNVVGKGASSQEIMAGSTMEIANDYAIIFAADTLTVADLENKDLVIIFKDSQNNVEEFRITDFEPSSFTGVDIMYTAYLRSTSR